MNQCNNISQTTFENFDQFFEQLVHRDQVELTLAFEAQECNGAPQLTVTHNQTVLFDQALSSGMHSVTISVPQQQKNCITIKMSGKNPGQDTEVVNGQIVKDKFVVIRKFVIDGFDLLNDQEFFYNVFWYRNNDQDLLQSVTNGFWNNSTLGLDYDGSFFAWYQCNTRKNTELVNDMIYKDLKSMNRDMQTVLTSLKKLNR
jgi:hypothetical protein